MLDRNVINSTHVVYTDQEIRFEIHFELLEAFCKSAYEACDPRNTAIPSAHGAECWLRAIVKWQDITKSIAREGAGRLNLSLFLKLESAFLRLISEEFKDVISASEIIKSLVEFFKQIIKLVRFREIKIFK